MRALFCLLILSGALAVQAGTLSFLKDAPIAEFTAADLDMMKQAAAALLDEGEAGAVREWKNSQTGHSGRLEVKSTFRTGDGRVCKQLSVENRAKEKASHATYPLCKGPDGAWMMDEQAVPAGKLS